MPDKLVTLVKPFVPPVLTTPLVILVLILPETPPNVLVTLELGTTTEFVMNVTPNVKLATPEPLVILVEKKPENYPTVNVEMDTMITPESVPLWKNAPKWNSTDSTTNVLLVKLFVKFVLPTTLKNVLPIVPEPVPMLIYKLTPDVLN